MNARLENSASAQFAARFGREPEGVVFAPGRVNLIGDHVDYNDGLVLPMPIKAGTAIAWGRREDSELVVRADDFDAEDAFRPGQAGRPDEVGWRSYVRGMASLAGAPPLDLLVKGDLPRGTGLSSSASLCIAMGRAFAAARDEVVVPTDLARIAQRVEHEFADVACGIMDQMAIAAGTPGHGLLLDCRDLSHRAIPIPRGWSVGIVQSGVSRGLVDGEYNARRTQCEEAARLLGPESLREASRVLIDAGKLEGVVKDRALHVVDEIERTRTAANAMLAGDLPLFGELLRASHASLRDLFEVSVPAVDGLVETLNAAIGKEGGARMTGGGFGGAVVCVFAAKRRAAIEASLADHPHELIVVEG